MPLETSPESPAPLRQISQLLSDWIGRLGAVWVEGEVAQLNRRTGVCFLTLRDVAAEVSAQVTCRRQVLDSTNPPVTEGARVVVHVRPQFYARNGSLSLNAIEIRPVGIGELLARIEQRRQLLAAEGLFDRVRKRPLPFLPRRIGLITGRDSAAERDVLDNARRRWPGVEFSVVNARVQGTAAAEEVIAALHRLDHDDRVDVVIVARGGGSVEDLLPFSDETLVRAVAACTTPVVSAIGHEPDTPLLDLVADLRASTPTDAAKRVVPDVREELDGVQQLRDRGRRWLAAYLRHEEQGLASARSRPALADPLSLIDDRAGQIDDLCERARRTVGHRIDRANDEMAHHLARVRGLSPRSTLARGYSVTQRTDDGLVTSIDEVAPGDELDIRVTDGHLTVRVDGTRPAPEHETHETEQSA
ncbi:exodeoxyribonuclease VII large subunit [Solicola gregarius]|uniref:Exodeoxyribonuclease 7 large subunit n=1 Tax=Solicola gregarius TaxID=2908642 RepID=A0AA46TJY4_9ACTN|nr:exodeoxyribonuclease VII large subunit [Solicola gregarius]UYM06242.1 exodeoxyribonuclease VII large subunit [Solicola gregarius]